MKLTEYQVNTDKTTQYSQTAEKQRLKGKYKSSQKIKIHYQGSSSKILVDFLTETEKPEDNGTTKEWNNSTWQKYFSQMKGKYKYCHNN